jgi:hypothetical protein
MSSLFYFSTGGNRLLHHVTECSAALVSENSIFCTPQKIVRLLHHVRCGLPSSCRYRPHDSCVESLASHRMEPHDLTELSAFSPNLVRRLGTVMPWPYFIVSCLSGYTQKQRSLAKGRRKDYCFDCIGSLNPDLARSATRPSLTA